MALSREHLSAIFSGCPLLSRLVLNCDIWCDSPVDDQLLGDLRRCCPLLEHLDLCPGNYQTTDACLAVMATFPRLRTLRLVEFSGITEAGLMAAIRRWFMMPSSASTTSSSSSSQQQQLVSFTVEDCCDIDVQRVMDGLRRLHAGKEGERRKGKRQIMITFKLLTLFFSNSSSFFSLSTNSRASPPSSSGAGGDATSLPAGAHPGALHSR